MIFEFGGSPELGSPREAVWRHLQDGDLMAACTPGTESFEVRGPGRYTVKCSVGSGLVRVHVVLEAELHDLQHPDSLRLRATGTAPGSTLDVDTLVRLESLDAQRTRLTWSSVTGVHGMLAGFGRGMVEDVLRQFTEKFWTNVAAHIAAAPRSGAYLLDSPALRALSPDVIEGAVLLASFPVGERTWAKGHRLTGAEAALLHDAAGAGLSGPVRLAWIGAHELHEAEAARLLATAAAGPGIAASPVHQGRIDLVATHRGVLTIVLEGLERINAIDPLELFTRWNHQPVEVGELVASVKTAPHIVAADAVTEGVRLAGEHGPLLSVRPYTGVTVAALAAESLPAGALERFVAASRLRAESLGGSFLGVRAIPSDGSTDAVDHARAALEDLAVQQRTGLVLIGGVSAGDPLAPLFEALEGLGGEVFRHGVPAHPGSMLWLGRLGATQLLGLPRCGAFSMATAADLLLPRLMAGEQFTLASIASLGHGGLLGREMRSRFPAYARELPEPAAS
ncbi:MAG: SRPBCC domain-containing protein [Gemmatimonadales bacterium]